jgi:tetratricopeptide (TPR) repeat protein
MANADDQLRQIALDAYMSKIPWSEGCYKSVFYFERSGNFRAAQTTLEALLEDYPFSFYAHYLLGNVQKETNNINAAFVQYKRSIELNPEYLYPYIDLGLLEINNGMLAEATRDLQTALRLSEGKSMPLEQASIYYGLSAIAANNGEMTKALEYTDQSLRMNPGYRAAQTLRANLLKVLPPR